MHYQRTGGNSRPSSAPGVRRGGKAKKKVYAFSNSKGGGQGKQDTRGTLEDVNAILRGGRSVQKRMGGGERELRREYERKQWETDRAWPGAKQKGGPVWREERGGGGGSGAVWREGEGGSNILIF